MINETRCVEEKDRSTGPTKCSQLRGYVLWAVLFYVAKSAGSSNRPTSQKPTIYLPIYPSA